MDSASNAPPPTPASAPEQPASSAETGGVGSAWFRSTWPLALGLASLALLWPLSMLTGVTYGAFRALTILGVTAVVWIAVVGIGHVARPVLTLTLTGLAYGAIALILSVVLPTGSGPFGAGGDPWMVVPSLVLNALWGGLAGLAAAGVQRLRGAR